MKVKYAFVNETNEIDVTEEWGTTLLDYDRLEYNNNQTERRRHTSLDGMEYEGEAFADPTDVAANVIKDDELHQAFETLLPQQRELLKKVYFEGWSIAEIARSEGVSGQAINNRLKKILNNLKNLWIRGLGFAFLLTSL